MQDVIEIIRRHSYFLPDWEYYVESAQRASDCLESSPDVAIECCLAIYQGVSKTIVSELDPARYDDKFKRGNFQNQVSIALRCLEGSGDAFEIEFPRAAINLVQSMAELRKERARVSHGQHVTQHYRSDTDLAQLIHSVSNALIRYMIGSYFSIKAPTVLYESNDEFNELLDETGEAIGSKRYSELVFEYDFDRYVEELENFKSTAGDET